MDAGVRAVRVQARNARFHVVRPHSVGDVKQASSEAGQVDASPGVMRSDVPTPSSSSNSSSAATAPSVLASTTSPSSSTNAAEALVMEIRREEFGFEGEMPTGGELQVKQNSRLARALKRLAGELYGSDVHWQLELLQNADDNTYAAGLDPTAQFVLQDGAVIFRCNETGFKPADIRAICDIGNSSKVGAAKYAAGGRVVATGEKGLGFKAVFALTNTPRIYSGNFRLEFDALHSSGIGYVLPRWLEGESAAKDAVDVLQDGWGSALRMPLRPDLQPKQAELFSKVAELPPSSLLFLKTLRDIAIIDSTSTSSASERSVRMRRIDDSAMDRWTERTIRACVEVSRGSDSRKEAEQWLLVRKSFEVPEGLAKPGISTPPKTTLVEVAVPLTADGALI